MSAVTEWFAGRTGPLRRLAAALDDAARGLLRVVLVSGEAGMGKTSLIARAVIEARARCGTVAWGTCWDAPSAPAFWPWTQALRDVIAAVPPTELAPDERHLLARLLPELGRPGDPGPDADDEGARARLFDAAASLLERTAAGPRVVVLDDLQWADPSSLLLLEYVARPHRPAALLLVGAYRHDELNPEAARLLGRLAARTEAIRLEGLAADEVRWLMNAMAGERIAARWAADVHRRAGGHPLFTRELVHLVADAPAAVPVPAAVRDAILGRLARLSPPCARLMGIAAVAGNELAIDVCADAGGLSVPEVEALAEEAAGAGVLVRDPQGRVRFVHDLFRETTEASLTEAERASVHRCLGAALVRRSERGVPVVPGEVARHLAEAVVTDCAEPALRWGLAAAAADSARLAFGEAAAHLSRLRRAIADAGVAAPDGAMVDALVAEADALGRAGEPETARPLLAEARVRARHLADPIRLGEVALAVQRLGARFAMPRDETVAVLEEARSALLGSDERLLAHITAGLARELAHSVPRQRARAGPLSEEALAIARQLRDPATLAACLLARHDALWAPGRARERVAVAREIATVAEQAGDIEHHCEGLLLTANALLEDGSAAFRPVLDRYLDAAERLGQPRHRYFAATRRAALALLDGRITEAELLLTEAAACGERIGEPDAGNVRMSQLLEVARALGDPDRLRATADEAIRWWVGVPSHAYAVAAGFHASAGDLAAARRCLDTVLDLGDWRDDRSYLRTVFLGGLATAAVALGNVRLCEELLAELVELAESCAVNGAVVCFMGSNAHRAGMLAAALGRDEQARSLLLQALTVHQRLGARAWEAETCTELCLLPGSSEEAEWQRARALELARELGLQGIVRRLAAPAGAGSRDAVLALDGDVWELRFRGSTARLRDRKGFHDLATLVSQPGVDVHVLRLAGDALHEAHVADPLLDARAREDYRRRLVEVDSEIARADGDHDIGRRERAEMEREALLHELRRATGMSGRDRGFGNDSERARKAVAARLRDVIQRIAVVLPELGVHLERSIRTGAFCRYEPDVAVRWRVGRGAAD